MPVLVSAESLRSLSSGSLSSPSRFLYLSWPTHTLAIRPISGKNSMLQLNLSIYCPPVPPHPTFCEAIGIGGQNLPVVEAFKIY
jgi:hypothetical protein